MTRDQYREQLRGIFAAHNKAMLDADAEMRDAFTALRRDALASGMAPAQVATICKQEQLTSVSEYCAASLSRRRNFFEEREKPL